MANSNKYKIAILSAFAGTALDQIEMTLFSLASAFCFGEIFFSNSDPLTNLISAFGIYGVGYLIRPLGGLLFAYLGEKYGRKWVLSTTVFLMGLATCGMGLVPSYASIGLGAPILLIILRCIQGLAVGAEYTSGMTYLAEIAPKNKRGLFSSFVWAGTSIGTVIAGILWYLILSFFTKEQVIDFAWRIPFLASCLVTMFALWMRLKLHESPVFLNQQANKIQNTTKRLPLVVDAWCNTKLNILRVIGLTFACVGHAFIYQVFMAGYFVNYIRSDGRPIFAAAISIGAFIGIFACVFCGWLTDKYGRRKVGLIYSCIALISPFICFTLVNSGSAWMLTLVLIYCFCMGWQNVQIVEIFGARYRYGALTISREIGAIAGGFVPMIALTIMKYTNNWIMVAIFISIVMLVGLITTYYTPETLDRDLYVEEDAI